MVAAQAWYFASDAYLPAQGVYTRSETPGAI
jgi:hypothetical protein